jgi:hypothetical protein
MLCYEIADLWLHEETYVSIKHFHPQKGGIDGDKKPDRNAWLYASHVGTFRLSSSRV